MRRKDLLPSHCQRVRQQYHAYRRRFPGDVLFLQVGRFVEFYEPLAQLLRTHRRGARYGFPLALQARALARLLAQGRSVVVIGETRCYLGSIQERLPLCRSVPCVRPAA